MNRFKQKCKSVFKGGFALVSNAVKRGFQQGRALVATAVVGGAMVLASTPAHATNSVVTQIQGITENAENIFNACIPIIVSVVAFGILIGMVKLLRKK